MAFYFLNRGLVIEQAVAAILNGYLDSIDVDGLYDNFHVEVTNSHPFATLYLHSHKKAADTFPVIVVSTQSDGKTDELSQLPAEISEVALSESDIDGLSSDTYESDYVDIFGELHKAGSKIAGLCATTADSQKTILKDIAKERGSVAAYETKVRLTDTIGIEIWADNEQVKNELYEIVQLFVYGGLLAVLQSEYKEFEVEFFDKTVRGRRSGNYNMDFDVALSGGMLSLDLNYSIRQMIVDTDVKNISEIIPGVKNYVKKE